MTIKGSTGDTGGPAVSLLASPPHRVELASLEPLTSCAFRQLMLQMELCSRATPESNNWGAAESAQRGGGHERVRLIPKIQLGQTFIRNTPKIWTIYYYSHYFTFHTEVLQYNTLEVSQANDSDGGKIDNGAARLIGSNVWLTLFCCRIRRLNVRATEKLNCCFYNFVWFFFFYHGNKTYCFCKKCGH